MDHQVFSNQQVFRYKAFSIDKTQTLGHGAYGAVYKAKCDQLPCAAKLIHATILDPMDPGADKIMQRFEQECAFLKSIRHPNIVQYLGMTRDPESKLPVLLMELLDESLTKMLECSQHPLPYHVQVDICHDIALAVAYLHSNDIIHRDLSSNNVLMIAGRRAKVTDFGMSKLAGATSKVTPLTMCPGTLVFMAPEALREPPRYTDKLDCFSEGVIMIQVCTRLWPEPGPRTKLVPFPESPTGSIEMPVLEVERRKNHIDIIERSHPLLPIAMDCLSYQESDRASSEELCMRLSALKESKEYRQNVQKVNYIQAKDKQMVQQSLVKDREIQVKTNLIQQLSQQLEEQKRKVEQLQQQLELHAPAVVQKVFKCRDIGNAPFKIVRGAAVVEDNLAYFVNYRGDVCFYNSTSKKWTKLPKYPYQYSSLAVIKGQLTGIGGWEDLYTCTDELLSLNLGWLGKSWVKTFPCMPTRRRLTTTVTSKEHLLVAGGDTGLREADCFSSPVEVMNIETGIWSTVASLPQTYFRASASVCGDHLYMLGGDDNSKTKVVLTCSLTELLQSSPSSSSVWHRVADAPAYYSTCATINGKLLTVGGHNEKYEPTAAVHEYNSTNNSWDIIGNLTTARWYCLLAVLPTNELLAVGGYKSPERETAKVEFGSLSSI